MGSGSRKCGGTTTAGGTTARGGGWAGARAECGRVAGQRGYLQQRVLQRAGLLSLGVTLEFQRNPSALGEALDRFDKRKVLVFLNEGEYVAAFMAAEAMENLTMRIDDEARSFLFVKWAERYEIRSGSLEWQTCANDLDDIAGRADLFQSRSGEEAGHGELVNQAGRSC